MSQSRMPATAPFRFTGKAKLVVIWLGVVVALVAGWNIWAAVAPTEPAWSTEVPDLPADMDGHAYTRAWIHEDLYIDTAFHLDTITARATATGEQAWALRLDAPLCGASYEPEDGRVAVQFRSETACDRVALVDLASGTVLWDTTLETPKPDDEFIDVKFTIADGLVVAWWIGAEHAMALEDGETVWSGAPHCHTYGWAGGQELLQIHECDDDVTMRRIDPTSGEAQWTYDLPDTPSVHVVSTDPIVVRVPGDFIVLDDDTERLRIPSDDQYGFGCSGRVTYECDDALVDGQTLYIANMLTGDDELFHRGMSAIDLTTGDRRWSTVKSDAEMGTPVHVNNGRLVSIAERKNIGRTGTAVRIAVIETDVESGEVNEHMAVDTGHIHLDDVTRLFRYADDTLVVQREYCKAGTSGETFAHAFAAT